MTIDFVFDQNRQRQLAFLIGKMFNLNGILKTLQNTIALNTEDEEEENNEYDEPVNKENDQTLDDGNQSDGVDEDLNLDIDDESDQEGNDEQKQIMSYYNAVNKINEMFPAKNFLDNPDLLPAEIEELCHNIQSLTDEQESVRVLYENQLSLKSIIDEINKEEKIREARITENQNLKEELADITQDNEEFKKYSDMNNNLQKIKKEIDEKQRRLDQQHSANEQLKTKIKSIQSEIDQTKNNELSITDQLEEERERYSQLLLELNSYQAASEQSSSSMSSFEDQEVANLEEEVNTIKLEIEKLTQKSEKINQNNTIEVLEARMQELAEKYQQICDDHQNENNLNAVEDVELELNDNDNEENNDFRINITSLLLKHYKGDKEAVNQLQSIFGWTQEEMDSMNSENKGISGFLKKGMRIFNRFTDSWTSWLIQAADSE